MYALTAKAVLLFLLMVMTVYASPVCHTSAQIKARSTVSQLKSLFPLSQSKLSWTTSPAFGDALPLSDSTFRPVDIMKALMHKYTRAPDGTKAIKAHYPKDSYNFQHDPKGGFSFYAPGPEHVDLEDAKEATLGYSVYFENDFDFNLGGKLPGLCMHHTRCPSANRR